MYGVPTDEIDNIEFQYQTRIGHLQACCLKKKTLFCMPFAWLGTGTKTTNGGVKCIRKYDKTINFIHEILHLAPCKTAAIHLELENFQRSDHKGNGCQNKSAVAADLTFELFISISPSFLSSSSSRGFCHKITPIWRAVFTTLIPDCVHLPRRPDWYNQGEIRLSF